MIEAIFNATASALVLVAVSRLHREYVTERHDPSRLEAFIALLDRFDQDDWRRRHTRILAGNHAQQARLRQLLPVAYHQHVMMRKEG